MGTDMSHKPASRRQVYAAIVLLDLPMPNQIGVDHNDLLPDYVHLAFSSIDDGMRWAKHFGVDCAPYLHKGVRYLGASNAEMLGRPVALWATEDQTDPAEAPLDDATRAQLAQVAEPQRGTCRYCGLSIVADDRHGWIHSDGIEACIEPAGTCAYPVNEPAVTR